MPSFISSNLGRRGQSLGRKIGRFPGWLQAHSRYGIPGEGPSEGWSWTWLREYRTRVSKETTHSRQPWGKIGMVSIRDVLGNADFTPMVTAKLKTRLIAGMMKDLERQHHPKWWVREFLPKAWQLVGESFKVGSPSRVLRRARKRQPHN